MNRSPALLAAFALTLPLAGCVENSSGDAIDVEAKEDACQVAADSVESGTSTCLLYTSDAADE